MNGKKSKPLGEGDTQKMGTDTDVAECQIFKASSIFFNVYLFVGGGACVSGGGAEREGERES